MKSYHFSVGDSTHGPIGMAARIEAESEEQALAEFKSLLQENITEGTLTELWGDGGQYICVYYNPEALTVADIDEDDDMDEEEDEDGED